MIFLDFFWAPSCFGSRLGLLYIVSEQGDLVIFLYLLFLSNPALASHWISNLSCFTVKKLASKFTWNCGDTNPVVRSNISAILLTRFRYCLRYILTINLYYHLLYITLPYCNFASNTYNGNPKGIQWFLFVWKSTVLNIWRGDCPLELLKFGYLFMVYFSFLERMDIDWLWLVFSTLYFDQSEFSLTDFVMIVSFVPLIHLNYYNLRLQMLISDDFIRNHQLIYFS